jgi:hypothetical protein
LLVGIEQHEAHVAVWLSFSSVRNLVPFENCSMGLKNYTWHFPKWISIEGKKKGYFINMLWGTEVERLILYDTFIKSV